MARKKPPCPRKSNLVLPVSPGALGRIEAVSKRGRNGCANNTLTEAANANTDSHTATRAVT
jgi:hypothetical protein